VSQTETLASALNPPVVPAEDSLKKRFLFKLAANFVGMLTGLATQAIIPRGLGPVQYGNFSFLTAFFTEVVTFLDSGTSIGFYSKLSQRLHDTGLIRFYWRFAALVSAALFLFVLSVQRLGFASYVWPDQQIRFVFMAAVWALLFWYAQIVNRIVDAYGLTVSGELIRIEQKAVGLVLILLMFWLNRFTLAEFFSYQYSIFILLMLGWCWVLMHAGRSLFPPGRLAPGQILSYGREFYRYSGPLVTYAGIGLLVGLIDRWFLQRVAGPVEQGFYSLSYQIGTMCFLFTSAMTPLFMRDLSKAHGCTDLRQMQALFQRYVPMLYSIAALLGVFIAFQAKSVVLIFGGSKYTGATLAISIMAIYPIQGAYGQLNASVFYATGQTRIYRNVGIVIMLLGLPITYLLLAPAALFGANLGATGLAVKMVLLQFIQVNLLLWLNTRLLKLSHWRFVFHQFYVVALLSALAWLATLATHRMTGIPLLSFSASGFLYVLACTGTLFLFPAMFSVSHRELFGFLAKIRATVRLA
jgi:O-antigen/teichoic acid export membrane protein